MSRRFAPRLLLLCCLLGCACAARQEPPPAPPPVPDARSSSPRDPGTAAPGGPGHAAPGSQSAAAPGHTGPGGPAAARAEEERDGQTPSGDREDPGPGGTPPGGAAASFDGPLPPGDPDSQGPEGPVPPSRGPRHAERVGTVQGQVAWEGTSPLSPADAGPPAPPMMDRGAVRGITEQQADHLEAFEDEYRLGAGDVVELFSSNNPQLSREYRVGPDGKFTLPVLGIVDVRGKTREQVERAVEDRMRDDYRNPQVTVLVTEYNNNRIYVLGEVGKPGVFNFQGEPMLLGALAQAQGVTERADMRGCTIIRGKNTLIEVDLYALLREGNRTLNVRLEPEDTVYVRENEENVCFVLGEVVNPGVYPIKRRMDAIRAIALAGGPTEDGAKHKTRILRRNGSEIQVFDFRELLRGEGDGTLLDIQPRDIIFVPRKHIAKFNYVLGELSPILNTIILGTALGGAL